MSSLVGPPSTFDSLLSYWQQPRDLVMSFPSSPSGFDLVGLNLPRLWFCGLGEKHRVRFPVGPASETIAVAHPGPPATRPNQGLWVLP